ncbi:hypothetical protein V8E53_015416 [Lactarius tabidus]
MNPNFQLCARYTKTPSPNGSRRGNSSAIADKISRSVWNSRQRLGVCQCRVSIVCVSDDKSCEFLRPALELFEPKKDQGNFHSRLWNWERRVGLPAIRQLLFRSRGSPHLLGFKNHEPPRLVRPLYMTHELTPHCTSVRGRAALRQ